MLLKETGLHRSLVNADLSNQGAKLRSAGDFEICASTIIVWDQGV